MKIALISGTSGLVGMQLLHQLLQGKEYDYVLSVGRRKLALKHEKLVQIDGDLSKINSWDWQKKWMLNPGWCIPWINRNHFHQNFWNPRLFKSWNDDQSSRFEGTVLCHWPWFGNWIRPMGKNDRGRQVPVCFSFRCWFDLLRFYNKVKGETEEDLKTFKFNYLGFFRPSLLLGNRSEFRFGELVATIFMKPLVWLKLAKNIRPIYDYQVAKAMVKKPLPLIQVQWKWCSPDKCKI